MHTKTSNFQSELLELVRASHSKLVAIDLEFCILHISSKHSRADRSQIIKEIQSFSKENPQWIYLNLIKTFVERFTDFCKNSESVGLLRWPTIPEVSRALRVWFGEFLDPQVLSKMTNSYMIRKAAKDLPEWKAHLAARRGPHQKRDSIQDFDKLISEFRMSLSQKVQTLTKDPKEDLIEFAKFMFEVSSFDSKKLEAFAAQALVQQFLELKR